MTALIPSPPPAPTGPYPVVIGHRGSPRRAPENTLDSFRAAWSAGVDWVEADVQPTADGVPVVLHDDTVDRTTDGAGAIRDLPWSTVRELTVTGRPGAVPALAALLTELTGARRLLLEIKGPHTDADLVRLLDDLAGSGVDHRVFLQSFERDVLARLRALAPDRPLGLLVTSLDRADLAAADGLDAVAVNPPVAAVLARPTTVAALRAAGRSVAAWTANTPTEWSALRAAGVDAVITDRPDELGRRWSGPAHAPPSGEPGRGAADDRS